MDRDYFIGAVVIAVMLGISVKVHGWGCVAFSAAGFLLCLVDGAVAALKPRENQPEQPKQV